MFVLTLLFITTFSHADVVAAPLTREAYCAGLLGDPGDHSPAALSELQSAVDRVTGRVQLLREIVTERADWTRPYRRAARELMGRPGAVRLRLNDGGPWRRDRRTEKSIDAAFEHLRDARSDLMYGRPQAFPVKRLVIGAADIRTYYDDLQDRARTAETAIERDRRATPERLSLYPGHFLGSTLVTGGLSAVAYGAVRIGIFAFKHHHVALAIAAPAVACYVLGAKLPPRLMRLALSLRDEFDVALGFADRPRPRTDARRALNLAAEIIAAAEDPTTPADLLIVAGATTPLPLRHIDTDRVLGSPVAARVAPTPAQIIDAMARRGDVALPIDPRTIDEVHAFWRDDEGRPTLLVLAREPRYRFDHR